MPKMKPGKDQGNAALPKLGSPWTSKHSQDLLKYNAVDDHAAHPMSMRGPLDKHHPMKKYGDPMKKYGPLSSHGPGGSHPDPNQKSEQLTKKQKLQAAGAALNEDVDFTLKTFGDDGQSFDPRSGRVISEIKSKLKKQKPEIYKDLYGA